MVENINRQTNIFIQYIHACQGKPCESVIYVGVLKWDLVDAVSVWEGRKYLNNLANS